MSDEGKIENEIINYSVNLGNKYNQAKNERELRKLIAESCPNSSNKVGVKGILVSIPALLQLQLEERKICELQITKNSLPQRFPLIPEIVNTPADYRFIQNFTSSKENLLDVIIKSDRSQNIDL